MAGQVLDMYIKVTAANLAHYVTNDVINCNSIWARYAVQNGDAIYTNSTGTEVVPSWPPAVVNSTVENAAATIVVINYDMAMAITDETGFVVTVAGSGATINSAAALNNSIKLTLSAAVTVGQTVVIDYNATTGNVANTSADAVTQTLASYKATNNTA